VDTVVPIQKEPIVSFILAILYVPDRIDSISLLYQQALVFAVEACTDEGKVIFVPKRDVMMVLWEHKDKVTFLSSVIDGCERSPRMSLCIKKIL
jgi:hypothetical protein